MTKSIRFNRMSLSLGSLKFKSLILKRRLMMEIQNWRRLHLRGMFVGRRIHFCHRQNRSERKRATLMWEASKTW